MGWIPFFLNNHPVESISTNTHDSFPMLTGICIGVGLITLGYIIGKIK